LMVKRSSFLFIVFVLLICGSIFILPHFLWNVFVASVLPSDVVTNTFVKTVSFSPERFIGLRIKECVFVIRDEYFLRTEEMNVSFDLKEFLNSSKPFVIQASEMTLVKDGEDIPILDLMIDECTIAGSFEPDTVITISNAIGTGAFGRFRFAGNISSSSVDIKGSLNITVAYLKKLSFVPEADINEESEDYQVTYTLSGSIKHPGITIASELFNVTLTPDE